MSRIAFASSHFPLHSGESSRTMDRAPALTSGATSRPPGGAVASDGGSCDGVDRGGPAGRLKHRRGGTPRTRATPRRRVHQAPRDLMPPRPGKPAASTCVRTQPSPQRARRRGVSQRDGMCPARRPGVSDPACPCPAPRFGLRVGRSAPPPQLPRLSGAGSQAPAQGADTLIWLAPAEEPGKSSGGYFHQRKPRAPNPVVDDDAYVDRLWEESEKLIAKAGI